jgi:hypothetical protein
LEAGFDPPELPVELAEDDEPAADEPLDDDPPDDAEEDESDDVDVLDFPSVEPEESLLDSDFIAFLRDSDG